MHDELRPGTADQVREAVREALARREPLEIRSRGSKRELGRPIAPSRVLNVSRLAGISLYEPEELVLSCGPATPLAELEALLADHGQMLPFEPPYWGAHFHSADRGGTIGGAIAVNASGPRRFRAGAARDFVLGVQAVSGFGESFKTGGRVVKNVTGYDVSKLIAGSFGSLAVTTELTLKVLPKPQACATLGYACDSNEAALARIGQAASGACDPSGLAALPRPVVVRCAAGLSERVQRTGHPRMLALVRIEGRAASMDERVRVACEEIGAADLRIDGGESELLWRQIRDLDELLPDPDTPLWRLSVPPGDAARVLERFAGDDYLVDGAGGTLWVVPRDADVAPRPERGSVLLFRASAEQRARLPVFPHGDEASRRITRALKLAFDPERILNRSRLYPDL
jgi:glycolate oxidase FAD binding subunit